MTASLDSSPRRFSSDHSHQHGSIAESKKKEEKYWGRLATSNQHLWAIVHGWERAGKIHKTASLLEIQLLDQLIPTAHGFTLPKHLNINMVARSTCQSPEAIQVYTNMAASLTWCLYRCKSNNRLLPSPELGQALTLPNSIWGQSKEMTEMEMESLTLIVSSARSKTAHCFGVRLLVSSLTIWSCKQPLNLTWVCCQRLKENESPASPLSLDSRCGYMARALIQLFNECLMESPSHLVQLNLNINSLSPFFAGIEERNKERNWTES